MPGKALIDRLSVDKLKKIVENSVNMTEAIKAIGYTGHSGSNIKIFKDRCEKHNIDYSHFTNQGRDRGIKRTFENVFCKDSTVDQNTLRRWYCKGDYTRYECSVCGINEWNGKALTLRLDHINGKNKDNRLENLRWLCPNCDSQSDYYCGRKSNPLENK